MIRALYYTPEGKIRTDINQGEFILLLHEEGGLLWIDMHGDDRANYKLVMERIFDFHPLAVDDALEQTQVPKVDDWGKYLYLVLHDFEVRAADGEMVVQKELDIFIGPGYMITYHPEPITALEKMWDLCAWDPRYLKRGAIDLLYHLSDALVEGHLPVIDQIEVSINEMEDQILHAPKTDTLDKIFTLKRSLLRIRRIMTPQREVFYKLSHNEFAAIPSEERFFFRSIYDHDVLLNDLTESLRELLASALEIYLSASNNRMNKVVQILTVITTMFMPLTFITGFIGMNFFQLEFSMFTTLGKVGLAVALICLMSVPSAMFFWIRRRVWM